MRLRAFITVISCLVAPILAAEPVDRLLPGQNLHDVHGGKPEASLIAEAKGGVERRENVLTIWTSETIGYAFRDFQVPGTAASDGDCETFSYSGGGPHYHLVHHTYCHDSPDVMVFNATGLHVSAHLGEDEAILSPSGLRLALARSHSGGQRSVAPLRIWRLDTGEEVLTCRQDPDSQSPRTAHVVEFTDDYLEVIIHDRAASSSTLRMVRAGKWRLADGAEPVPRFTCSVPPA